MVSLDGLWIGRVIYGAPERAWIDSVGKHYLQNAVPGALFAIGVHSAGVDLLGAWERTDQVRLQGPNHPVPDIAGVGHWTAPDMRAAAQ